MRNSPWSTWTPTLPTASGSRPRQLSLILIEYGDSFSETESQLARLRFNPAIASEAVHWAWSQQHSRMSPEAA